MFAALTSWCSGFRHSHYPKDPCAEDLNQFARRHHVRLAPDTDFAAAMRALAGDALTELLGILRWHGMELAPPTRPAGRPRDLVRSQRARPRRGVGLGHEGSVGPGEGGQHPVVSQNLGPRVPLAAPACDQPHLQQLLWRLQLHQHWALLLSVGPRAAGPLACASPRFAALVRAPWGVGPRLPGSLSAAAERRARQRFLDVSGPLTEREEVELVTRRLADEAARSRTERLTPAWSGSGEADATPAQRQVDPRVGPDWRDHLHHLPEPPQLRHNLHGSRGDPDPGQGCQLRPAPPPAPIRLKVINQQGVEVHFSIKRATPLRKLMDAYCARLGAQSDGIQFLAGGVLITPSDTAELLGLEDFDIIDATMVFRPSTFRINLATCYETARPSTFRINLATCYETAST